MGEKDDKVEKQLQDIIDRLNPIVRQLEPVALPRKWSLSKPWKIVLKTCHYIHHYTVSGFLHFLMFAVWVLLLAWIACPVFLNFDAGGALSFTKPWGTPNAPPVIGNGDQRKGESTPKGTENQPKKNGSSSEKNMTAESTASVKVDLATNKCDVSIKKTVSDAKDKQSSGNVAGDSSLKYVNVGMTIAAYILGLIFLALVLRGLRKAERKHELLGGHGGVFRKLLAASPDRAEHQKTFMREMMRVYFDKEAD